MQPNLGHVVVAEILQNVRDAELCVCIRLQETLIATQKIPALTGFGVLEGDAIRAVLTDFSALTAQFG